MDEALLEADVLGVAEAAIGVERRWVVGPDVEHDLVARSQQVGRDRAGDRGREAAAAVVGVGQDVADDGQAGRLADDMGTGGRHELAVDAQAVVDAVADRRRRQPGREAELVEPVQVADLDRQQPLDGRRVRPELRAVDPHPDHGRPRVDPVGGLDRREDRAGAATYATRGRMRSRRTTADAVARGPSRTAAAGSGPLYSRTSATGASPSQASAPARPRELALLEVADGVGGVQPVALEEGAEERLVGRHPGDDHPGGRRATVAISRPPAGWRSRREVVHRNVPGCRQVAVEGGVAACPCIAARRPAGAAASDGIASPASNGPGRRPPR